MARHFWQNGGCGWLQPDAGGFGWFRVVSGGLRLFLRNFCKKLLPTDCNVLAISTFDIIHQKQNKMSAKKEEKYRDAGSGQYVKKEYAEKHKGTTVKETSKNPGKK